jgi:hypothetical protein
MHVLSEAEAWMSCPGGQDDAVIRAVSLRRTRGFLAVVV